MKTLLIILLVSISNIAYAQTSTNSSNGDDFINIPAITTSHDPVRYIVNNIEMSKDEFVALNLLSDTSQIESLTILKDMGVALYSCASRPATVIVTLKENIEHHMVIAANGYESFLATQTPKEFYTIELLRSKNTLLANEWNRRCESALQSNQHIYGAKIDYDSKQKYGLAIEYQLYIFFKYMERENQITLL